MRLHLTRTLLKGTPVLFLHQMGKVGSSTVYRSLQKIDLQPRHYIVRSHFLSEKGIQFFEALEEKGYGGWSHYPKPVRGMLARDYVLGESVRKGAFRKRGCKIVTLVRDPVAVNVAGFFQNNDWWPRELKQRCLDGGEKCVEALRGQFLKEYPHQVPLTWFDEEMKDVFDIDVFATPFPHQQGYAIYKNEWAELLVLRLEDLDAVAAEAFAAFLGIPDFRLIRDNAADAKWYASIYDRFKKTAVLPQSYFQEMYESTYVRHFYTGAEIEIFKSKWQRQQTRV